MSLCTMPLSPGATAMDHYVATVRVPELQRGAPTVFGWPAFFFVRGRTLRGLPVALFDRIVCGTYLLVCLPAFTLLGTLHSVLNIVDDWGKEQNSSGACGR